MNWGAISCLIAGSGIIVTIVASAISHGMLIQRVKNGEDRNDGQDAILKQHGDKLDSHGEKIGRLEGRLGWEQQ